MGSLVSLGVGRLEVDWGKNEFFRNHSALFLPYDVRDAPYYYADDIVEQKPAFVRGLPSVAKRLEMLGYTLDACRERYESAVAAHPSYYPAPPLSYDQFAAVLSRIDVHRVRAPEEGDFELGELAVAIMRDPEFTKTNPALASLDRDGGTFFENLDPYVVLRLLAESPANRGVDVVWGTEDIVEGGYVEREDLYEGVAEEERCLVVTEGSSDGAILRDSLPLVLPDISDFFHFVDMSENYPFTGTGNVVRFCQGLARIHILNRILVVLDNDTAGREAYLQIARLDLPPRMRVTQLPNLEQCRRVKTLGPSGIAYEDINGKAVSIECFLDIWAGEAEPVVRWTNYSPTLDAYHGALVQKEAYTRRFFDRAKLAGSYNLAGLTALWNHLVGACAAAS
jgi:hypothetical protein